LNWLDSLIGPTGLLLVISHVYAVLVLVLVLLVGLEEKTFQRQLFLFFTNFLSHYIPPFLIATSIFKLPCSISLPTNMDMKKTN
jgi:hypothetical protein